MRVFLVDDEPDYLDLLHALVLRRDPAAVVHVARSAAGAVELLRLAEPGDVAIIDHGLPDGAGPDVADHAPVGVRCYVVSADSARGVSGGRPVADKLRVADYIDDWLGV